MAGTKRAVGTEQKGATKPSAGALAAKAGISDAAVAAKTGKNWAEWAKAIDAAGGRKMDHREIVALLSERHALGPWWRQMVAVGYEKITAKRVTHQKADGFSVSVSVTAPCGVAAAYDAFAEADVRRQWLGSARLQITSAKAARSLRMKWLADGSRVEIQLVPKGPAKTQAIVEQSQLKDAAAAAKAKAYWKARLVRLAALLAA